MKRSRKKYTLTISAPFSRNFLKIYSVQKTIKTYFKYATKH